MRVVATAPLTVKLRCASWRQLRTIYERDLKRESFFLKSKKPPPIGTGIRIQLTLPSESMVILHGEIRGHVPEGGMAGRGPGIDIGLGSIPQSALWLIETALKASTAEESMSRPIAIPNTGAGEPAAAAPKQTPPESTADPSMEDGEQQTEAEDRLLEALAQEYESLQKLNPYQLLGVAYEADDDGVRTAFGQLTKKYHPDRFRRFEGDHIREYASEIFILIRNAYQQLKDEKGRRQVSQALESGRVKSSIRPPTLPHSGKNQLGTAPTIIANSAAQKPSKKPPPTPPPRRGTKSSAGFRLQASGFGNPRSATSPKPEARGPMPGPEPSAAQVLDDSLLESQSDRASAKPPAGSPNRFVEARRRIDAGDYLGARNLFRVLIKRDPEDNEAKAGVELSEGLKALAEGDRMEAAQKFEMVLELDPSNERAARELAEMRRRATNQRKGLLTRLLGQRDKD